MIIRYKTPRFQNLAIKLKLQIVLNIEPLALTNKEQKPSLAEARYHFLGTRVQYHSNQERSPITTCSIKGPQTTPP